MSDLPKIARPSVYDQWSDAVAKLLCCPWELYEAQCRAGLQILETVLHTRAGATPTAGHDLAAQLRGLQQLSVERVRQGLAPPKEIYQTPYRNRIDWSALPEWARPSDPELFEGSSHEG
jgi:hypothetical protein